MRWMAMIGVLGVLGCGGSEPELVEGAGWVFTTSRSFTGDFGGLPIANAACQTEATAAGLEGTFFAWLSTSSSSAIDNIAGTGPWLLAGTDREVFANRATLTDLPAAPIDVDATGTLLADDLTVWTGTATGGEASAFGSCRNWTRADDANRGAVGGTFTIDGWTETAEQGCDRVARLYCFGS